MDRYHLVIPEKVVLPQGRLGWREGPQTPNVPAASCLVLIYRPATIDHKLLFVKGSNRPVADVQER